MSGGAIVQQGELGPRAKIISWQALQPAPAEDTDRWAELIP
jgi:hypothetical protein